MIRRRTLAVLLALLLLGCAAAPLQAQIPVPPLAGRVTDTAGVLSATQRAALEETLRDFERRKGSQVAVLVVPTTQPETIEQFGIRVAEAWKLGRKGVDDGAIVLVAVNDRTLRIEVGYGLEGVLPDAIGKRIVEEVMLPRLRAGDLPGGIRAGVDAILRLVEGEALPAPGPSSRRGGGGQGFILALVVFFFLINALGWLWRAIFGRLLGAGAGAGAMGALAWFLTGAWAFGAIGAIIAFVLLLAGSDVVSGLLHSGGRRGGSMRGALGGGRGFGGLGGGGFGGGGGGFGGGGASGRW
jgi:uncharacterized protein